MWGISATAMVARTHQEASRTVVELGATSMCSSGIESVSTVDSASDSGSIKQKIQLSGSPG